MYPKLLLQPKKDKRLRHGHLWFYGNEVDTKQSPAWNEQPGSLAQVCAADGRPLGIAQVNPNALLCGRMLSKDPEAIIDQEFWRNRLHAALRLREARFQKPFYRLVHGEGDGLPGLIVDRYGDYLVMQNHSAGMELAHQEIGQALQDIFMPKGILLKNDGGFRDLENLPKEVKVFAGQMPELVEIEENDTPFLVNPVAGQKTGWFFDHRANRRELLPWVASKHVLDLFSYSGSWGIQAARAGAETVTCVDGSAVALELLRKNAEHNGVTDKIETEKADAFEFLKKAVTTGKRYQVIILDPPAFIKSRKDHHQGLQAYRRLNGLALKALAPGGILASASCSFHLGAEELHHQIALAVGADVPLSLVYHGRQDADHPVHAQIPEGAYLKALFFYRGG